uniref:Uncharacterized protein n=1 Tax=Panagrolaimus sp. ES5 TaxID=591445 RepID=A0AC34GPG8_9BILA
MMDDEEYQKLLREEQAQIAISILYDAGLKAIRAKNEEAQKEVDKLEHELLSVKSELATLSRFKGVSQQQCFTVKAEGYRINGEKQKTKQLLHDVDQSLSYWKNVGKKEEEKAKNFNDLNESPWMIQKRELKEEVGKLNEILDEQQKQLAELENSKKYKSSKTSVDTQTIEMFRSKVRSDLRLNPQRASAARQRANLTESLRNNDALLTPPRPERASRLEATPTPQRVATPQQRNVISPHRRRVSPPQQRQASSPQPRLVESQPESDTDAHMEFDDKNSEKQSQENAADEEHEEEEGGFFDQNSADAIHLNITDDDHTPSNRMTSSPIKATPPDARPKPIHNYTPRNEDHLFKVPELPRHAPSKNVIETIDDDMNNSLGLNTSDPIMDSQSGPDFFNLLDDNQGSNSDNPAFSFLQEHTNNSDGGGANFFFGNSSPQAQKDESSHGFLF